MAIVLRDRDDLAGKSLQTKERLQDIANTQRQFDFADAAFGHITLDEAATVEFVSQLGELRKPGDVSESSIRTFCDRATKIVGISTIQDTSDTQRSHLTPAPWLVTNSLALQQLTTGTARPSPNSRLPSRLIFSNGGQGIDQVRGRCFADVDGEDLSRPDKRKAIAASLVAAAGNIDVKFIQGRFRTDLDSARQPWIDARKDLERFAGQNNQELEQYSSQLKLLDHEVANADTRLAAQEAVDSRLVYATYGMIGALFVLGMLLIRSDVTKTSVLIEQRTIVELVSIGFMLVTIIILGAGKRLTGETLGALLGTIAGYVFGREIGGRKALRGDGSAGSVPLEDR